MKWLLCIILVFFSADIVLGLWTGIGLSRHTDRVQVTTQEQIKLLKTILAKTKGEEMAKQLYGPVDVTITVGGSPLTIPVSVEVTQGEDVAENVATPPESETRDQCAQRGIETLQAVIDKVKAQGQA